MHEDRTPPVCAKGVNHGMITALPVELPPEELTDAEREILRLIRELGYGKIVISVKNGNPVHAELQKSVLL